MQAEEIGEPPGQHVHRALDREDLAITHIVGEQEGSIARPAEQLAVGAGVSDIGKAVTVVQQLDHHFLVLWP